MLNSCLEGAHRIWTIDEHGTGFVVFKSLGRTTRFGSLIRDTVESPGFNQ